MKSSRVYLPTFHASLTSRVYLPRLGSSLSTNFKLPIRDELKGDDENEVSRRRNFDWETDWFFRPASDWLSTDFRPIFDPERWLGFRLTSFDELPRVLAFKKNEFLASTVKKFDLQRLTNVRWFFDFKRTVSTPFSTWFRPRKITEMSTDEFWAFPTCFDLQKERIPGFKRREMTAEFCCVSLLWFWPLVELCGRATKFLRSNDVHETLTNETMTWSWSWTLILRDFLSERNS